MIKKPLITIVIASYNSGKTIFRALQSVEAQTFDDWECLVIDGASKDNTIEIVKDFTTRDKRFRYISEPDKGIYDAFNKGWRNATGEWIYYLGSDDWLTPHGMNELSLYTSTNAAIISGDVYVRHLDGNTTLRVAKDGKPDFGYHQGMIMRRETLEKYKGFDMQYPILADYDLLVRIIQDGGELKIVKTTPIAFFSQGGTTSQFQTVIATSKDKYLIYKTRKNVKFPLWSAFIYGLKKIRSLMYRNIRLHFKI